MEYIDWNDHVKRLLKAELIRRKISHEDLAIRLQDIGVSETKSSIDSKISRGTFSAAFLLQCLYVIGCKNFVVEEQLFMVAETNVEYKKNQRNEND